MDLSVAVTPLYFGAMAFENRKLKARAAQLGPGPADYERSDTITSLAMGVGSLAVPICQYLGAFVVPRKGRFGKVLAGTALAAGVATTVADRVRKRRAGTREAGIAERVASVGGVATVTATALMATTGTAYLSSTSRQWAKGKHHDLGGGVVAWSAAMLGWDLAYYWNHRLMHEIRGMWAIHVVHHSSEHYNLSTALRQPVANAFGVWVPYGALARVGVRPSLIETSRALNLIYQFWIHTDTIRSLGPAEEILNTPSHHRVHHGSNRRYIDRNHGGILIVWDRLFGTFARERDDEPVVYGLTKNIHTYDLVKVVTHEYRDMFRDIARSTTWKDRLSFVLRTPGWAYRRRDELDARFAASPIAA